MTQLLDDSCFRIEIQSTLAGIEAGRGGGPPPCPGPQMVGPGV